MSFSFWPGRKRKRPKRRRRLQLTREGRLFLAITIGIGLAAINTGNNLLYLLLGWLLSLIVASGALSNLSLRGLKITRRAPPRIHAHRPFLMELSAENTKRRFASFSIEVEDLAEGFPVDKKCFFLKIPQRRTMRTHYRHTFHRRGMVHMDGFRISTRFPFALFRKSNETDGDDEILVYPAIRPVSLPPPSGRSVGDSPQRRLGRRGEFFGLRDYREGDDSRGIHWRSSARTGRLLVRENQEEAQKRIRIELDNAIADQGDEEALDRLEEAVSQAASLVVMYLKAGFAVGLVARGLQIPPSLGPGQERRLLRELALLEAETVDTPMPAPRDRAIETVYLAAAS